MAQLLASALAAAAAEEEEEGEFGGGEDVDLVQAATGADAGAAAADIHSDLMLAAQEQLVAEQEGAVHAFHQHLPRAGGSGGHGGRGGSALISLLVLIHLAVIVYWGLVWWRQRKQRSEANSRKPSAPQKVGCTYDWTPVIPQLPKNIQLASKSAQH